MQCNLSLGARRFKTSAKSNLLLSSSSLSIWQGNWISPVMKGTTIAGSKENVRTYTKGWGFATFQCRCLFSNSSRTSYGATFVSLAYRVIKNRSLSLSTIEPTQISKRWSHTIHFRLRGPGRRKRRKPAWLPQFDLALKCIFWQAFFPNIPEGFPWVAFFPIHLWWLRTRIYK